MSNEELVELIQTAEDKKPYIEALYHNNENLIKKVANKFVTFAEFDDLTQEGFFGLVKSAELWRKDNGTVFSSFAYKVIFQTMKRYVETTGSVIRVPSSQRSRIFRYKRTLEDFREQYNRDPSVWELSVLLEISKDQIKEIKRDVALLRPRSLSETVGNEDSETFLEDVLSDDRDDIGDLIERQTATELSSLLWSLVDNLEKKQSDVIRSRYKNGLTLKECGTRLGVDYKQTRLIEAKALREMRKQEIREKLRPYYDIDQTVISAYRATGFQTFINTGTSSPERFVLRKEEIAERRE